VAAYPDAPDGLYIIDLDNQSDGRVFSWIKLARHHKAKQIVAVADPILDQLPHFQYCGLNAVIIEDQLALQKAQRILELAIAPYATIS